jgi:hypothetical protein
MDSDMDMDTDMDVDTDIRAWTWTRSLDSPVDSSNCMFVMNCYKV